VLVLSAACNARTTRAAYARAWFFSHKLRVIVLISAKSLRHKKIIRIIARRKAINVRQNLQYAYSGAQRSRVLPDVENPKIFERQLLAFSFF